MWSSTTWPLGRYGGCIYKGLGKKVKMTFNSTHNSTLYAKPSHTLRKY